MSRRILAFSRGRPTMCRWLRLPRSVPTRDGEPRAPGGVARRAPGGVHLVLGHGGDPHAARGLGARRRPERVADDRRAGRLHHGRSCTPSSTWPTSSRAARLPLLRQAGAAFNAARVLSSGLPVGRRLPLPDRGDAGRRLSGRHEDRGLLVPTGLGWSSASCGRARPGTASPYLTSGGAGMDWRSCPRGLVARARGGAIVVAAFRTVRISGSARRSMPERRRASSRAPRFATPPSATSAHGGSCTRCGLWGRSTCAPFRGRGRPWSAAIPLIAFATVVVAPWLVGGGWVSRRVGERQWLSCPSCGGALCALSASPRPPARRPRRLSAGVVSLRVSDSPQFSAWPRATVAGVHGHRPHDPTGSVSR